MFSCGGPWPLTGAVWASLAFALVGMFGSLDITLLVGSLIVLKKKKIFEGLHAFLRGVNDGFDCCADILIILLFSLFLFFSVLKTVVR